MEIIWLTLWKSANILTNAKVASSTLVVTNFLFSFFFLSSPSLASFRFSLPYYFVIACMFHASFRLHLPKNTDGTIVQIYEAATTMSPYAARRNQGLSFSILYYYMGGIDRAMVGGVPRLQSAQPSRGCFASSRKKKRALQ